MTCYVKTNGKILQDDNVIPCTTRDGVQACCSKGDQCGHYGFCYVPYPESYTMSPYYIGGCTDQTFEDESCPQYCGASATRNITYNSGSGQWICCVGNGNRDCEDPNVDRFRLQRPAEIFSSNSSEFIPTITTTATETETKATTETITTTTTATATNITTSTAVGTTASTTVTQGASTGAATQASVSTLTIFLAVVIIVVVLLNGAALFCWFQTRRRKRSKRSKVPYKHCNVTPPAMHELPDDTPRTELSNRLISVELGSPLPRMRSLNSEGAMDNEEFRSRCLLTLNNIVLQIAMELNLDSRNPDNRQWLVEALGDRLALTEIVSDEDRRIRDEFNGLIRRRELDIFRTAEQEADIVTEAGDEEFAGDDRRLSAISFSSYDNVTWGGLGLWDNTRSRPIYRLEI